MADKFSSVIKPSASHGSIHSMLVEQQSSGIHFERDSQSSAFGRPRFSMHDHMPSALDEICYQIWDFDFGSEIDNDDEYIVKVERMQIP